MCEAMVNGRGEKRTLLLSGTHAAAGTYYSGVLHGILLSDPNSSRWTHVSGVDGGSVPAALLSAQSLGAEDPIEMFHTCRTLNSKLSSGRLWCGMRMPVAYTANKNLRIASEVLGNFLAEDRVRQSGRVVCTGLLDSKQIYNPSYALKYHTPQQEVNDTFLKAVAHSATTLPLLGASSIGSSEYISVASSGMMLAPVPLNVTADRPELQLMVPTEYCDVITTTPRGVRGLYHSSAFSRQMENSFTANSGRSEEYTGSLWQISQRFGVQFRIFSPRISLPATGAAYGQLSEEECQRLFEIGRAVASRVVHSQHRGYLCDEYSPPVGEFSNVLDVPVTVPAPAVQSAIAPTARFLNSMAVSGSKPPARTAGMRRDTLPREAC